LIYSTVLQPGGDMNSTQANIGGHSNSADGDDMEQQALMNA
jgi:hypothetical protein